MAPPPSQQLRQQLARQPSYQQRRTLQRPPSHLGKGGVKRSPRTTNFLNSPYITSGRAAAATGGRNMFLIDPKTFATRYLVRPTEVDWSSALEGTNSTLVRFFVWAKKQSESWFSHVLLLLALIAYACIGGWIFNAIEGKHETEQNDKIRELHGPIVNMSEITVEELWKLRSRFMLPPTFDDSSSEESGTALAPSSLPPPPVDPRFMHYTYQLLDQFEGTVMRQCAKRLDENIERFTETEEWNFIGSVFFSMTVFTTIGYGDNPPQTTAGKAATMVYSFIGIPLLLMVLTDFGRIFTRWIKMAVLFVRRLYYLRSLRGVRRLGRQATRTARIQQAVMDALTKIQRQPPFFVDPITGRVTMWPTKKIDVIDDTGEGFGDIERQPPPSSQHSTLPRMTFSPATPTTTTPDTPLPPETLIAFSELDDEFNLPISLALFILMLYLLLGAIIFWSSENWSLFHAFYFVFISMSTIGFGDFVPGKANVLLYAFIYLLFGLALTSMCINVIQEKLSSTFEMARMTIGETIGLDPSTPITIVNPDHKTSSSSAASSKDTSRKNSIAVDGKDGGGGGQKRKNSSAVVDDKKRKVSKDVTGQQQQKQQQSQSQPQRSTGTGTGTLQNNNKFPITNGTENKSNQRR